MIAIITPRVFAAAAVACALIIAPGPELRARANDVDIGERAGEAIGKIAQVTNDFTLTDVPANLEIEADRMAFDYDQGELRYDGNVKVRHGEVSMRSEKLLLTFNSGRTKSLKTIEASGNVEVQRGEERASGEHASYDPNRRIITLTGKASLGSGTNRIGGESVVVYLAERRAEVKGGGPAAGEGGRVRAVIDPKSLDLLKEPTAR
jgi:lipopolysaccharide export system protein LptA